MSIFGEPLPHEDDTAASLIRRTGFPPDGTYEQMPEVYLCPCCSEFSKLSEHDRLLQMVQAEKEAERRRILQLDVFDERAKPLPFESGRRPPQWVPEDDEVLNMQPNMPPPPTLDELRRRQNQLNDMRLVVTVHHGKNLAASPRDPMSVVVRCGGFEGQTAKVPLKKGALTTWDELFEFPYQNPNEPLELLVLNDQIPGDHLLGCILIPNELVKDATSGDETILPIESRRDASAEITLWDGISREGTMGSVVVSWYISKNGQDRIDETAIEQQALDEPVRCSFVTHHIFQYTDNGSEPFAGGVLCVLRDTDDNCSESILYNLGSTQETSFSPYFSKEGYHYLPENAFKGTQLTTNKKLGHILICVPKEESGLANEEEELLVIGAVPLDFGRLHRRGNAVLLIESKSKDDALWGEIFVEWDKHSLSDLNDKPELIQVPKESVFVTVVRGDNLCKHGQEPLEQAMLAISTENLEGTTMMAPRSKDEGSDDNVIHWNQEVRFIGVARDDNKLELVVYEEENLPVTVGSCVLSQEDEGVCIVKMHEISKPEKDRGEVVLSYRRFHGPDQPQKLIADQDSLSQNDEEVEEQEVSEEQEEHEDAEDRRPIEIDRESDLERPGEIYDELLERNDANSRSYETPVDDLNQFKGEGDDRYKIDPYDENDDELDRDSLGDQQRLRRQEKSPSESRDARRSPSTGARDMQKSPSESRDVRRSPSTGARDMQKSPSESGDAGKSLSAERARRSRSASMGSQDGGRLLPPLQPQKVESQPPEDKPKKETDVADDLRGSRRQIGKSRVEPVYLPPPPEPSNVHSDRARASKMSGSSSLRRQSTDNGDSSRRSQGFIQPWYPAGNPESQQHVPYERSTLSLKNKESIRELERRRNRIVEESVRRGTSPRATGTRGLPEEPNDEM
ncbi:unnamed protein product [Phytomonas sp. EM1]|nr:unnamed protein product [Phytomonas sp. EM1]|eukprot:CCW64290.1 unnamed protein product [Phytomonas sp. isolate EM1]